MARRLRFNGTGSGGTGCPSVHEDIDSGDVIVHGPPLTDPEEIAQLQHLSEGETAVVVPREVLVDWTPKGKTRKAKIIGLDQFEELFRVFQHTAWRLETRRRYASDEQTDTYRQFTQTGNVEWDPNDPYCELIRSRIAQGKRVERVRIVDNPPTTGQLYLLNNAERNASLGEDIRILPRADADRLLISSGHRDWWLFDSRFVATLRFDDDDQLVDVELITEPAEVVRCNVTRDTAWHHAVPYREFAAGLGE
ncbi:hypothetical protein QIS99_09010 [Streptomyces sp. B-S-A8]|uniref:DUF6879 domain-containing protein n=1 Tax=Streptomyces solicavernae TaxID=3043614 RepID=A0ABT6RPK7_9ACTN|nr:DUF6879 family protein [Streptomyces sp. B-S-A8]MDI3386353.1 hypothetical protein [Streptomyces sp. B-S-A8]